MAFVVYMLVARVLIRRGSVAKYSEDVGAGGDGERQHCVFDAATGGGGAAGCGGRRAIRKAGLGGPVG